MEQTTISVSVKKTVNEKIIERSITITVPKLDTRLMNLHIKNLFNQIADEEER